jgi:methyl-accepting chemotaxis protein
MSLVTPATASANNATLAALQRRADGLVLPLIWLLVPVALLEAMRAGSGALLGGGVAAAVAVLATLAWAGDRGGMAARIGLAVGLMAQVSVLVLVVRAEWRIDLHMAYFAALAVLSAYICPAAVLAGTATVAVHHLVLNYAWPEAVFGGEGDLARVVLHAVILLVEAGVLLLAVQSILALLTAAATARDAAHAAAAETARMADEAAHARRDAEGARTTAARTLAQSIEGALGAINTRLSEASRALGHEAGQLTVAGQDNANRARGMDEASGRTAGTVQTVAAAAEELSASIALVARNVTEVGQVVGAAAAQANASRTRIDGMTEAADRIGDVVQVIGNIAAQTNLLALNATIEAARAGDAGKGFAVVAGEVKTLAGQTAKATEEIARQIGAVQDATGAAAEAIGGLAETVARIEGITAAVVEAIGQQSTATAEIAAGATRAAQLTQEVAEGITAVGATAQRTSAAAAAVDRISAALATDTTALDAATRQLLHSLRGA